LPPIGFDDGFGFGVVPYSLGDGDFVVVFVVVVVVVAGFLQPRKVRTSPAGQDFGGFSVGVCVVGDVVLIVVVVVVIVVGGVVLSVVHRPSSSRCPPGHVHVPGLAPGTSGGRQRGAGCAGVDDGSAGTFTTGGGFELVRSVLQDFPSALTKRLMQQVASGILV
jgi:hypothetical protein